MVTNNDGVRVGINAPFERDFNAHNLLHPEAVDSDRCPVEAVCEWGNDQGLKPRQGDQLEWHDDQKARQPNHQVAEKPDTRQDA